MQPPKGTVSLEQMVQKYGIEEAAARAQMTPQELAETLVAKNVTPKAKAKKAPAKKTAPKGGAEGCRNCGSQGPP
jgi:DNA-binding protein H-NS